MSNEVQNVEQSPMDVAMAATAGNSFPAYMNLLNAKSPKVAGPENEKFKPWIDEFVIVDGDNLIHVAKDQFDVLILACRMKAMRRSPAKTEVAFYPGTVENDNHDIALYQQIVSEDRLNEKEVYRTHGPEFLLWLPVMERIVTFHMCSWSARTFAGNQLYKIWKAGGGNDGAFVPATIYRFYEKKGNARYLPKAREIEGEISNLPDDEFAAKEVKAFREPPKFKEKEEAAAAPSDR